MTVSGIVSGGVYPELALEVAQYIDVPIVAMTRKRFSSGERYVRLDESVRGRNLYIIQSFSEENGYTVNDALFEVMLIIDAARRASAGELTVVLPLLPYSRQDRKALNREPISVAVVIRILEELGVTRIISVDLHSPQTQAVFNGQFDHLIAQQIISESLKDVIGNDMADYLIVSPDTGRAKESEYYADELGVGLVHLPKARQREDPSKITRPSKLKGVGGKKCILIDDMIDTSGTLMSAADTLVRSGAESVLLYATHGILSGGAAAKIRDSAIGQLYLVDTLPQQRTKELLGDKVTILPIAPLLAESLKRVENAGSISTLFDGRNFK